MSLLTEPTPATRLDWLPLALVLVMGGWASNQFVPMLLVYGHDLSLGAGTTEALFGAYAVGLVPGLLLSGPAAEAWGRRRVVTTAAGVSLAACAVLVATSDQVALLFAGRLLTGLSTGALFGAGTGWLRAQSLPPLGDQTEQGAARRAVVAMTIGFAGGPLVAGLLAAWAPADHVVPYLPHALLGVVTLALIARVPDPAATRGPLRPQLRPPELRTQRFRRVVVPLAPWVFAAPAVSFALLPAVVNAEDAAGGVALVSAVTALCALSGVAVQPLARRLDRPGSSGNASATAGLLAMVAGMALGAVTAATDAIWLLVPDAVVLGAAYGLCQVAGLVEVQRLAAPRSLAALTGIYYVFTYIGFALPVVCALAANLTTYTVLLAVIAALATATAASVTAAARGGASR